jgi:hypothetical protein
LLAVVPALALGLTLGAIAFAYEGQTETSEKGIAPTHLAGASNTGKECDDINPAWSQLKFEGGALADGSTLSNSYLSVTIERPSALAGSLNSFDWTATQGIDAVVVKNGVDGANLYTYAPPSEETSDRYLTTPFNGDQGISHISFCYDIDLTATKTADATYTRTYTWEIDKSVAPDSHVGFIGDSFSSDYDVVVTQTVVDSDFAVSGNITITNPSAQTVSFSVTDSVGGTAATVVCPQPQTLAAGASTVCTYSADLGDTLPPDGTNTATITSLTAGVGGTTASDAYEFGDPTTVVGYPTVNVTDTVQGALGETSSSTTFEYSDDFDCPTDPDEYTDGVYEESFPNTATIVETEQDDPANVDLTCYAPLVSKTADTTTYDQYYEWDVDKTVDPVSQGGFPGDELEWTWSVTASKTALAADNAFVSGVITVVNPNPAAAMVVALADVLDDGTVATIYADADCDFDGTELTVPADSTATCDYDAEPAGITATKNVATATLNEIDFTAEAGITWVGNDVNADGVLTDIEIGLNEELTGDGPWGPFTGDDSVICSSERSDYFVGGVYTPITETIVNWAYVHSNDVEQDRDDATTTWTCDASFVDILKTTNGSVDPTRDIRFKLYDSTGAYLDDEVSTFGDADGQLQFETALVPGDTYTVCEAPVPAGYTFEITVDGGVVLTYAGPPGAVDPTGEIQCFDFEAAASGTTLLFEVNNSFPGGAPRTPGYWKNWNTCTGGNQAETAAKLGGTAEGVYLLDDLLPQLVGDLNITTCQVGVKILNTRTLDGKNMSSDAAFTLARAYLAALLNQDAGACVPTGTYGGMTFQQVMNAAQALLAGSPVDFDGSRHVLGPKAKGQYATLRTQALNLAWIIDAYNNGELCTGTPSH